MKDFKEMQSDSESVVEIKQQEEQCHHRIAELYCHPNCEKLAQICEKRCKNNLVHDIAKIMHERKPVDQFKTKFNKLQAIFADLAQTYVKQLDQIEKSAINNIAKKKVDCLNEIGEYKKELMKQTYSDLINRFPHLYEKFKSNRLDTLNCNEVSWVMKTEVRYHNQKHSTMDSKFVAIIKKFENFKDVSKNMPHKLFTNKQNAKDMKIITKNPQQQHVVRLKPNISLEKPNYYQDKSKQELQYLQNKKRQLESSIRNLTARNSKLSDEISRRIYQKRERQVRIKITGKLVDWHFENINKIAKPQNNKVFDDNQSDSESDSSSLSPQIYPRAPLFNTYPTILQIMNKEKLTENKEKPTDNTLVVQKSPSDNRMINQAPQNTLIASEKVAIPQNSVPIHQENKDKIDEKIPQNQENDLINPVMPQAPAQPQPNQQNIVSMQIQKQSINKVENKDKIKPSVQVKVQHTEENGFQEWNNKQLVADIKRFGKNEQQGLKVENIEGLRSFSHVRLPSAKLKINPFLKKINKVETTPSKPLQYQDLAKVLMDQYMKSKQKEKDDKERRL